MTRVCSADGCERPHHGKGLCKSCYAHAWYKANRAWRKANREKHRARDRAWYKANPEKAAANARAWYKANREKHCASGRAWRQANPEKGRAKSHKRRALKAGAYNDGSWLPIAEVVARQRGKCAGCTQKFGPSLKPTHDHIDPLDNGGGHTMRNQQALCGPCNSAKGARLEAAQLAMV